jgi:predicted ABC-type ATPase
MYNLTEGPRDPHIFKAIFMAGIPGSGKSTISKLISSGTGLKTIDFDEIRKALKNVSDFNKIDSLIQSRYNLYINGRLGLIIDKTSQDYNKVIELKTELESIGYDTLMIYVNTDLEIAKSRATERFKATGREVSPDYIDSAFKNLSRNIGLYQSDFQGNFIIVDNTEKANVKFLEKTIQTFLNKPPSNKIAKDWIQDNI